MTSSTFAGDNWSITAPNYWRPAPQAMSFSALQQIEACPLQWALLHAKYANLGNAGGYPKSSNFSALRGSVLHRTLAVVIRGLVAAGCTGLGDRQAIAVMKSMGGFTALISRTVDDVLAGEADNFRMRAHQSSLRLRFVRELPEIRERLQFLLSRLRVEPGAARRRTTSRTLRTTAPSRGIGNGVYHEVVLRSQRLGWTGTADLIEVAESHVQITEFKTSEYSELHMAQLYTYAVLWRCDERLNPSRRLANRLVVSYPEKDVLVPQLAPEELSRREKELLERTQAALIECAQVPPRAKPDPSTCPHCQVRQLCATYWTASCIRNSESPESTHSVDCEIRIISPRGPRSWNATLLSAPGVTALNLPQSCVLYLRGYDHPSSASITSGTLARLLNCRLRFVDESLESELLLETTPSSEIFRVRDSTSATVDRAGGAPTEAVQAD